MDIENLLRLLIRRIKCETKEDKERRRKGNTRGEKREKQKRRDHLCSRVRI